MKKSILLAAKAIAAAVLVALFLNSCALFAPVAAKIASGVEKYCDEPYSFRQVYRNTINSQLTASGHVVHVHCLGDPATP